MIRFLTLLFAGIILSGCAHKGTVSSVRATNVYSNYSEKISGTASFSVDGTSLTKLRKEDSVQGYVCAAHHYPVDGAEAFNASINATLEQIFDDVSRREQASSDEVSLLFRVERFEPRMRFHQKFWGVDAEATVELGISVVGYRNGQRVFGTSVDSQRTRSGDGGAFCEGGGEVVADATREVIKDVLEKVGERIANAPKLRGN